MVSLPLSIIIYLLKSGFFSFLQVHFIIIIPFFLRFRFRLSLGFPYYELQGNVILFFFWLLICTVSSTYRLTDRPTNERTNELSLSDLIITRPATCIFLFLLLLCFSFFINFQPRSQSQHYLLSLITLSQILTGCLSLSLDIFFFRGLTHALSLK